MPIVEKSEVGKIPKHFDFGNEEQMHYLSKALYFVLLLLVEFVVVLQQIDAYLDGGGWVDLFISCGGALILAVFMASQLFFTRTNRGKIIAYILNVFASGLFLFFADGSYSMFIYMIVLTQFYIETKQGKKSLLLFGGGVLFYMLCIGLELWIRNDVIIRDIFFLIQLSFSSIMTLLIHFLIVQIAIAFYRQYMQLNEALTELEDSKKELEKAYSVVAEVTALEERQRIAKDIHDTAGHSLTTVIMQTESAKRIIGANPEEAKAKIVAANLQAKHALEELRNSVHLLSGVSESKTLKEALVAIIHESTDGTGINIRSDIEELTVSSAKYRFLCNTLKEGISNGLRHGSATAFWFELKEENGKIQFLLSDNGKGVNGKIKSGFGLSTMQERAKALGGEVTLFSEPEEGFELKLVLPIDAHTLAE